MGCQNPSFACSSSSLVCPHSPPVCSGLRLGTSRPRSQATAKQSLSALRQLFQTVQGSRNKATVCYPPPRTLQDLPGGWGKDRGTQALPRHWVQVQGPRGERRGVAQFLLTVTHNQPPLGRFLYSLFSLPCGAWPQPSAYTVSVVQGFSCWEKVDASQPILTVQLPPPALPPLVSSKGDPSRVLLTVTVLDL